MKRDLGRVAIGLRRVVILVIAAALAAGVATKCLAAGPPATDKDKAKDKTKDIVTDKETLELADKLLHPWKQHKDGKREYQARPKLTAEQADRVAEYLRQEFPYRSLRDRLAYEKNLAPDRPSPKLNKTAAARLADRDTSDATSGYHPRATSLAELHSDKVREFISRDGFGEGRMIRPSPQALDLPEVVRVPLDKSVLSLAQLDGKPVPLPAREPQIRDLLGKDTPQSVDDEKRLPELYNEWNRRNNPLEMPSFEHLSIMHKGGSTFFAFKDRNGDVKDVDHVAGFKGHAIEWLPDTKAPIQYDINSLRDRSDRTWLLTQMQLVSLLKHEQPGVYLSDNAPNMKELKDAKTRPLNAFESGALKQLKEGEDVVVAAETNRITMLGSLRASTQCMECHEVKHGELLGAFSYELIRSKPVVPASKKGKLTL